MVPEEARVHKRKLPETSRQRQLSCGDIRDHLSIPGFSDDIVPQSLVRVAAQAPTLPATPAADARRIPQAQDDLPGLLAEVVVGEPSHGLLVSLSSSLHGLVLKVFLGLSEQLIVLCIWIFSLRAFALAFSFSIPSLRVLTSVSNLLLR